MEDYKKEFADFMLDNKALLFGDFTLKSGRKSPFFMNAGLYNDGSQLEKLGEFYARAIHDQFGEDFDLLFGPAYKGIPLAVATAQAFYRLYGKKVRFSSDRKEIKDHGEKSGFLGAVPKDGDRIVIVEDVTTSGQSIRETLPKIRELAPEADIVGLMVSLNRKEKGTGDLEALAQIEQDFGFPARSIVTMPEIIAYLDEKQALEPELKERLKAYYDQYGSQSI